MFFLCSIMLQSVLQDLYIIFQIASGHIRTTEDKKNPTSFLTRPWSFHVCMYVCVSVYDIIICPFCWQLIHLTEINWKTTIRTVREWSESQFNILAIKNSLFIRLIIENYIIMNFKHTPYLYADIMPSIHLLQDGINLTCILFDNIYIISDWLFFTNIWCHNLKP